MGWRSECLDLLPMDCLAKSLCVVGTDLVSLGDWGSPAGGEWENGKWSGRIGLHLLHGLISKSKVAEETGRWCGRIAEVIYLSCQPVC